jgi:hypothetical protein
LKENLLFLAFAGEISMDSPMRLLLIPLSAVSVLTIAFAGCDVVVRPTLQGSGNVKTETREVSQFTEIEVGNAIQLDATIGPANSLVVTADDNLLPHIKTVVAGNRLRIYIDSPCSTDSGIKVTATAPALRSLFGSGASQTTLSGIAGATFELDLSGASSCRMTGDADEMDITLSGASRARILGTVKRLNVQCSGASQLDATELTAETVAAELSGASTGHVNVTNELSADASGASTLYYAGQPGKMQKRTSGASNVAVKTTPLPELPHE